MNQKERLMAMDKEKLVELLGIYAKDWLAMDGVWFQAVERRWGMDAAMDCDVAIWKLFTVIEAEKIKKFLSLPEKAGLEGLARALRHRLYANINEDEITIEGNTLIYRTLTCRVQAARKRKGMPCHPCKDVGIVEYGGFAKVIDPRISCTCISCYPDVTDRTSACVWKFELKE